MKGFIRNAIILLIAFCICASICSCNRKPGINETEKVSENENRIIVDCKKRNVTIPKNVKSIVCVGVGALRYSSYLEGSDLVIGVEDYETKPGLSRLYNYVNFDKYKNLPIIGTNGVPNIESIIVLNPEVIVKSSSASIDSDELSMKTGIPVVEVPGSDTTLDDMAYETIRILGELFGKEERANFLTQYLKGIEKDLNDRTKDIPQEKKPSVYVAGVSFKGVHGFEGTEANYGPFVLINAKNLANTTKQDGAFNIDKEQVLAWNPEIIFIDFNGLKLINEDYKKNPQFYESFSAVKNKKVFSQISFRSCASNLDTALADAYYAAKIIYPEQFKDLNIVEKASEIFTTLLGDNPYEDLKKNGYDFIEIEIGK